MTKSPKCLIKFEWPNIKTSLCLDYYIDIDINMQMYGVWWVENTMKIFFMQHYEEKAG